MLTDESKERAGRDDVPPPRTTEANGDAGIAVKVDRGGQERAEP